MIDLPSREQAAMFVDPKNLALMDPAILHGSLVQDYLLPPLRAIASGRLVDREAMIEERVHVLDPDLDIDYVQRRWSTKWVTDE